eukprot:g2440.t1
MNMLWACAKHCSVEAEQRMTVRQAAAATSVDKREDDLEQESHSSSSSGSRSPSALPSTQPPTLPTTNGFDQRPEHLRLSRKQARLKASPTPSKRGFIIYKPGEFIVFVVFVIIIIVIVHAISH